MKRHTQRSRPDGGFTLIELLVATAIFALLMTALTGVFVVLVKTESEPSQRLDESRSTQNLTTWFPIDVQNTPPVPGYVLTPTSSWPCAGSPPGENVVEMRWARLGGGDQYVAYRYVGTQLDRYACSVATPEEAPQRLFMAGDLKSKPVADASPDGLTLVMTLVAKSGNVLKVNASRLNLKESLCASQQTLLVDGVPYGLDTPVVRTLLASPTLGGTPLSVVEPGTLQNSLTVLVKDPVGTQCAPPYRLELETAPSLTTIVVDTCPASPSSSTVRVCTVSPTATWALGVPNIIMRQNDNLVVGNIDSATGAVLGPLGFTVTYPCKLLSPALSSDVQFVDSTGTLLEGVSLSASVNSGCYPKIAKTFSSSGAPNYFELTAGGNGGDLLVLQDPYPASGNVGLAGTLAPSSWTAGYWRQTFQIAPGPTPSPSTDEVGLDFGVCSVTATLATSGTTTATVSVRGPVGGSLTPARCPAIGLTIGATGYTTAATSTVVGDTVLREFAISPPSTGEAVAVTVGSTKVFTGSVLP